MASNSLERNCSIVDMFTVSYQNNGKETLSPPRVKSQQEYTMGQYTTMHLHACLEYVPGFRLQTDVLYKVCLYNQKTGIRSKAVVIATDTAFIRNMTPSLISEYSFM